MKKFPRATKGDEFDGWKLSISECETIFNDLIGDSNYVTMTGPMQVEQLVLLLAERDYVKLEEE